MTQPCRVPGCKGKDDSLVRLCPDHYGSLPKGLRLKLSHAVLKGRGLSEKHRSQILLPVIEEALSYIEAKEREVSLFEEAL